MLSSRKSQSNLLTMPVASFQYRHLVSSNLAPSPTQVPEESAGLTSQDMEDMTLRRLAAEWDAGYAAAEVKLRQEFQLRSEREIARISSALCDFEQTRKSYFSNVESEVVKLSLAIAGKIIHREAQVDPMLIAAIVQIALGQLKEGSSAIIRVRPEEAERFNSHFQSLALPLIITVAEDDKLHLGYCLLETELGTVNFSLNAQLKEVEQGFFDVLAQKPRI